MTAVPTRHHCPQPRRSLTRQHREDRHPRAARPPPVSSPIDNLISMSLDSAFLFHPQWAELAGLGPLTIPERALAHSLITGQFIDLRTTCRPSAMHEDRAPIRASLIRALVRGQATSPHDADPHGLAVIAAILDARLDLDDTTCPWPLRFIDCILPYGLTATRATLHHLELDNTVLDGDAGTGPTLDLGQARINRNCTLTGCALANTTSPTINADGLVTEGAMTLTGEFTGAGELGVIRLLEAHIGGQLLCSALITHTGDNGPAVGAECLAADHDVTFEGIYQGSGPAGTVRLAAAHIGGQLNYLADTTNSVGLALHADEVVTGNGVNLVGTYEGSGAEGTVRLLEAHIGGQFSCDAQITNTTGPALRADHLATNGTMTLAGTYIGSGQLGTVSLGGARVGAQFDCIADMTNTGTDDTAGPALTAASLTVDNDLALHGSYTGNGEFGSVCLDGARIGGLLVYTAEIINGVGPALAADGLSTGNTGYLGGTLTSTGQSGVIRLAGTHIGADLILAATINAPDGSAAPDGWLVLDGLTYSGLPRNTDGDYSVGDWIDLLSNHTVAYAAQPWQHAAAAWQAAGDTAAARRILTAQQDARRKTLHPGLRRTGSWLFWKGLTGYGYQAWRSLVALLILTGVAALTTLLGVDYFTGTQCLQIDRLELGIGWAIPIIFTTRTIDCTPTGYGLTIGSWIIKILGWVFVTLFISGFAGIIRKTHD